MIGNLGGTNLVIISLLLNIHLIQLYLQFISSIRYLLVISSFTQFTLLILILSLLNISYTNILFTSISLSLYSLSALGMLWLLLISNTLCSTLWDSLHPINYLSSILLCYCLLILYFPSYIFFIKLFSIGMILASNSGLGIILAIYLILFLTFTYQGYFLRVVCLVSNVLCNYSNWSP